jgi:hypothetical protein
VSFGEEPTPDVGRDDASLQGREPPPNRLRPLNLGDVLDGAFRLVREHWRAFAIGLGIVVLPLALLFGLTFTSMFGARQAFFEDTAAMPGSAPEIMGAMFAAFGLAMLAYILLTPLLYGTAVHIAATGYRSPQVDPMASLRTAGRRYFALLGASILLVLVMLLGGIAAAAVIAILVSLIGQDLAFIGFLIAFVAFVFVMTRVLLTFPALMIERVGPAQALLRSNALVKGKTGMVFLTVLIVSIISAIVVTVLTWPIQWIGGAVAGEVGAVAGAILGQIVSILVSTAVMGAALVLIYFDRRVRTEGYDLTELAGELGAPQDPSR